MITSTHKLEFNGMLGMGKRQFNNEVLKPAFQAAGEFWAKAILPKHFTNRAYTEYGFQKRTAKYVKKKLTFKRHNLPLVYSGELRETTKTYKVTPSFKGVKVTLPKSRKANRSNPKGPNMANELRAVSAADMTAVANVINDFIRDAIGSRGGAGRFRNSRQFQPTRRQRVG